MTMYEALEAQHQRMLKEKSERHARAKFALAIYDSETDIVRRYERGYGKTPVETHNGGLNDTVDDWAAAVHSFVRTPLERLRCDNSINQP